jgi:hypothetical protein
MSVATIATDVVFQLLSTLRALGLDEEGSS